jgi:RNA polymerase sigma factor (sigma-70 family)
MTHDEIAEAYRQYGHMILRRCRRALKSDAAAQDVVQEVFFRLWRYGENFKVADSKPAWLHRIAQRCCCNYLARFRGLLEGDLRLASSAGDPSRPGREIEDRDIAMRFLEPLDDQMRRVAILHYVGGMTQKEVAKATGWSRQTVFKKLRFIRGRARSLRMTLLFAAVNVVASS